MDPLLKICDVCITPYSMAGIDAANLNIPVVMINLESDIDLFQCIDAKRIHGIFTMSQLEHTLKKIFGDAQNYRDNIQGCLSLNREASM